MEYKAAFFDVDSTLTAGINQPVVESAVEAIKQLKAKGIKIVIASGRMPYGLENIRGKIEADFYNCANGQFVCDKDLNVIDMAKVEKELFDQVNQYCIEKDLGLFWKFVDGFYIYNQYPEQKILEKTVTRVFYHPCPDASQLPTSGALICDREKMLKFSNRFSDRLDVVDGGYALYDLDNKGRSKRDGLLAICRHLNISPQQTIAFGDSDNDLKMLQSAGLSIAMGNGFDSVKEIADYVTDTAKNDGIMKALKKFAII
ncbi:MAG: HAD family hydrolase [Erysipelotrichaceae bacterium]